MKREIKFRVYIALRPGEPPKMMYLDYWDKYFAPTAMQYTGLKDKNGRDIYEGDILDLSGDNIVDLAEVCYMNDGFKLIGKNYSADELYPQTRNGLWGTIIGNRWENPELLEEEF